jgi:hypothetical protein
MKAIKVEYTVKPEYVDTNKANIQKVVSELRSMEDPGILYSVYVKEDGCSFVHFAIYGDDRPNIIPTLASFLAFRDQLKAEGLEGGIQSHTMEMAGSSFDL